MAVIVILAIIALIATPVVLNIISSSKDNLYKRDIEMYSKAVKNTISQYSLKNNNLTDIVGIYKTTEDKTITKQSDNNQILKVEYDGDEIVCNYIEIHGDGTVYLEDCLIGNYEETIKVLYNMLEDKQPKKLIH